MYDKEKVTALAGQLSACGAVLTAIGDETRRYLMVEMMQMGSCTGVRVGQIAARTHLSRPAVSHHLQILRAAGILKVRREGTMNFYYFDPETQALEQLMETLRLAAEIAGTLPDRSGREG